MNTTDIRAVEHIREMTGKTGAHLMRASDGHCYVTKFMNNPLGVRVLASEFLATKIGLFLGLPMPEVSVIAVPDVLIKETPGLQMETENGDIIRCAPGRHLAIRYAGDVYRDRIFDAMPRKLFARVSNKADFLRVLPFDKWLGNCDDRQAIFVGRAGDREYHAVFIDQHDCFDGARWQFLDDPRHGLVSGGKYIYRGVTGWDSFEPTLSRIENMGYAQLWKCAARIPHEWIEYDGEGLFTLIETLYRRRMLVRDLITGFRNEKLQSISEVAR